jgi:hypothetical protein
MPLSELSLSSGLAWLDMSVGDYAGTLLHKLVKLSPHLITPLACDMKNVSLLGRARCDDFLSFDY